MRKQLAKQRLKSAAIVAYNRCPEHETVRRLAFELLPAVLVVRIGRRGLIIGSTPPAEDPVAREVDELRAGLLAQLGNLVRELRVHPQGRAPVRQVLEH